MIVASGIYTESHPKADQADMMMKQEYTTDQGKSETLQAVILRQRDSRNVVRVCPWGPVLPFMQNTRSAARFHQQEKENAMPKCPPLPTILLALALGRTVKLASQYWVGAWASRWFKHYTSCATHLSLFHVWPIRQLRVDSINTSGNVPSNNLYRTGQCRHEA